MAAAEPIPFPEGPAVPLPAGAVTGRVIRIADTVRRPPGRFSAAVAAHLEHLACAGVGRAPRHLGQDDRGRDVLTYLDGEVPGRPLEPWAIGEEVLADVARLLRRLHDAAEGFELPPGALEPGEPAPLLPEGEPVIVTHRDVTPWNTVFRHGRPWGVIDFDLLGPTTRAVDLANTASHWVPLCAPEDRVGVQAQVEPGPRLRTMYEAYGSDHFGGTELLHAAELRFEHSRRVMPWRAQHLGGDWARLWRQGIGEVIDRRIGWLAGARPTLADALDG